jgi:hypothetical protein
VGTCVYRTVAKLGLFRRGRGAPAPSRSDDLVDYEGVFDGSAPVVADRHRWADGGNRVTDGCNGPPVPVQEPKWICPEHAVVHNQQVGPLSVGSGQPETGEPELVTSLLAAQPAVDGPRLATFRNETPRDACSSQYDRCQHACNKPDTHKYQI